MNLNEGRQGTQWTEREFARNRYFNFLGSDRPATIACKEILDNLTDQISDGKTNYGYFEISDNFHGLTAVDGGKGISLRQTVRKESGKTSTFLYLNIAKLYTSTNYEENGNANSTVGTNGIGSKMNCFLSKDFCAGIVANHPQKHTSVHINDSSDIYDTTDTKIKGYHFVDGEPIINGEAMDEAVPQWFDIKVPKFYGCEDTFGYMVHAEYDTDILGDEIDCNWIKSYLEVKLGQCKNSKGIYLTFRYPIRNGETVQQQEILYVADVSDDFIKANKKKIESGEIVVLKDWETRVNELIAANPNDVWGIYKSGYYSVVFAKNLDLIKEIPNICQNTKVENGKSISYKFKVGQNDVSVPVYCVFNLASPTSRGLPYTDQTKTSLGGNRSTPAKLRRVDCLTTCFEKSDAKSYYESVASNKALNTGKKIRSDFYWEATGGETARSYFSTGINNDDDVRRIFNSIKDDPDVVEYMKANNIDSKIFE